MKSEKLFNEEVYDNQKEHVFGINTILHTKDGRVCGNAIIVAREDIYWVIMTDYGNKCRLTEEEIRQGFWIGWEDYTLDKDGATCSMMQDMMSSDHKNRVK